MNDLTFYGKKSGRGRGLKSNLDVGIRVNKAGSKNKREAFAVIMRRVPRELKDAGYVEVAPYGDYLYFKPSDKDGFKITHINGGTTGTFKTSAYKELIDWGIERVGDYDWIYDDNREMHCIKAMRFIKEAK